MSFLQQHPFAVRAHFDTSLVLTYAVPRQYLQPMIPSLLEIDAFQDNFAFIAAAFVKTRQLRHASFPRFLGRNFTLAGYRVFVRYYTSYGKRLRGLFILRSETDSRQMNVLGNLFTHYKYTRSDIIIHDDEEQITLISGKSRVNIIGRIEKEAPLPEGSPFHDWHEARRFAGPLPFTFSYDRTKNAMLIVEGVRDNWTPEPVRIEQSTIGFIEDLSFRKECKLANAFIVRNIPYQWKKGRWDKCRS